MVRQGVSGRKAVRKDLLGPLTSHLDLHQQRRAVSKSMEVMIKPRARH